MSSFRDVINSCLLSDLKCNGDQFTWCNRWHTEEIIFQRLDRFLCNCDWQLMYPLAEVNHFDFYGSDHRLISSTMKLGCEFSSRKWPKRFMFEYKWMMEEDFQLIMDQWSKNEFLDDLSSNLYKFSGVLKSAPVLLTYVVKLSHLGISWMSYWIRFVLQIILTEFLNWNMILRDFWFKKKCTGIKGLVLIGWLKVMVILSSSTLLH